MYAILCMYALSTLLLPMGKSHISSNCNTTILLGECGGRFDCGPESLLHRETNPLVGAGVLLRERGYITNRTSGRRVYF